MAGLWDYCIIQSFMDTCRKQGRNPIDMLRLLLSGGDIIEAVFGADKTRGIKYMIALADIADDASEIECITPQAPIVLTEKLLEAAAFGRLKVLKDPPPDRTKPSSVPKDKMQAARERLSLRQKIISVFSKLLGGSGQSSTNNSQSAPSAPS